MNPSVLNVFRSMKSMHPSVVCPAVGFPKISIITPCYNMAEYLEATIISVLSQNYPNLEYIIIDGGSNDGCREIIAKYAERLHYWSSEADQGMYHAIQKGFEHSTGDVMGWINADDLLLTGCLISVARAFTDNPECSWVQGLNSIADESGRVVAVHSPNLTSRFQFLNRECFTKAGELVAFGTLQQESTFWRRSLWMRVHGLSDCKYRLAGDFFLWMKFFRTEPLYLVYCLHGAFRVRAGQQSVSSRDAYVAEMESIVDAELKMLSPRNIWRLRLYACCRWFPILRAVPRVGRYFRCIVRKRLLG